jgi:3-deoxy-D-manno-octulosonate 8-phosphate phosphatase (KDO 8-P phosphatase)
MRLCGFIGCPADAIKDVKMFADYVSRIGCGYGAVRDCIEYLLRESREWDECVKRVYGFCGV